MDPTQRSDCGSNSFEEVVPSKKRRLTNDSDHIASFENTEEYTLADSGEKESNIKNDSSDSGIRQNDFNKLVAGDLGRGVTNVLDGIFDDNSETRPGLGCMNNPKERNLKCQNFNDNASNTSNRDHDIHPRMVSNAKTTASQRLNKESNLNDISIHPLEDGNEHNLDDLKENDLYSVHKLTFTSDTQEYTLVNDSQDHVSITDTSNEEATVLDDLDKVVSASDSDKLNQNAAIVLEDEATKKALSLSDGLSKKMNNSFQCNLSHDGSSKNDIIGEENNDASTSCVKKVPSLVRDAKIISSIVPSANYNIIYNKLLENRENTNRLDIVTASVLEGAATKENDSLKPARSIIEDVEFVIKQFPEADADIVYAFLESIENESDRVERTIKEMGLRKTSKIEKKPNMLKKDSTLIDDPVLVNDPLFNDMRKVAKVFPDRDRNEIYALLEAHVGEADRIQIVINELLREVQRNDSVGATIRNTNNSKSNDISKDFSPAMMHETDFPDILPEQEDVEHLRLLFPDCDPNYLFEKVEAMKDVSDRRNVLAAEMFEKKNYPRLKDRLEKEKLEEEKKKQTKRNFTVEEFLNKFPDPQMTFGDPTKSVSDIYKQHARASMLNDYLMFKADYLMKILEEFNYHYYLASKKVYDVLVQTPMAERRLHRRFMKTRRKKLAPVPAENDEYFFHEHWFAHNELHIEDHKKQKAADRQAKVEEARENGDLYECCCCFEDECLFEDLANCPEGHLFCKVCVVRSTEAAFGEMKSRFPCLTGECDQDITLSTLQGIVPPNLFSKIVSRLQEEEVLQAQIPDLVTCPFCPFATIMPDPEDKILKCLNPECLKESCRLCREESHIPLKCSEVESRAGTKMRTFIENKVAEAVMRKCHKCGKKFLKDSGCNKMTCVCGANSCYFCKEPNIDYNHFNNNKKCAQTEPSVIHDRDMKDAAKKAMEEYIQTHPEAADLDLQSDLKGIIQNYEANSQNIDDSINMDDIPEPSSESESEAESERDYYSDEDEDESWFLY